ncbi:general secretion pathway protein GspB [Vibrio sinaloensis]|nr:general secretion pathway protein GspB [Vibrio sinaloensis]
MSRFPIWHTKRTAGKASCHASIFQTHVYSSNPNKRWVKVNGTEFSEGDVIAQGVVLERIEQNLCQLRFEGEVIEVPALYDWQG